MADEFIKNVHHDDKISMVMSWDDVDRAKNLFLSLGDIDRGATSVRDILLEKLDADIESMLASIRELREKANYQEREDEFFTAIEPRILSL